MEKFARLEILSEKQSGLVECKCICGKLFKAYYSSIKSKHITSCGCWKKEKEINLGLSRTHFYNAYRNILARCNKPNSPNYKHYGGRGIKCEWQNFQDFYTDMFNTYEEGLSIERTDNDGNYSKSNCKWITRLEQTKNKTNTILYNGKCLMDALKEKGFNKKEINRVYIRIWRGWDIEKAINTDTIP